jgi:hypothetical protein
MMLHYVIVKTVVLVGLIGMFYACRHKPTWGPASALSVFLVQAANFISEGQCKPSKERGPGSLL